MTLSEECRRFYELRDPRSLEYVRRDLDGLVPVHVAMGATAATSGPAQLALLALANQLGRVSRRISFDVPHARVLVRTPFGGAMVRDVLLATCREINPCGEFSIGRRPSGRCVTIGLGEDVERGLDWYIGADRAVAYLRREPVSISANAGTMRGAALVSCLGAGAVFRSMLGLGTAERTLSAWNYAEGDAAAFGPGSMDVVDAGRVLMVGAGAVGAAVAYWLHAFGVNGEGWAVVDGDNVELHNTNRALVFTARDAGWVNGRLNGTSANKAKLVAPLIARASAHGRWYDECEELRERKFDAVLALANGPGVRAALTNRHAAVALQATTGENWLSQMHRHVLGKDGCIDCRTGEVAMARFGCAGAEVELPDGTRSDAALPFLSAASGLMLVTSLQRLATDELAMGDDNCWSWDFSSEYRMAATPAARPCRDGCPFGLSGDLRRRLTAGTRWASLVG